MPNRMPAEHALCRSRGFTLIELVVTVAVIALGVSLAAIALRDSAAQRGWRRCWNRPAPSRAPRGWR